VFSVNYSPNNKLSTCIGGGYNIYNGLHFGEIIWAQNASNSQLYKNYYNDTATKKDFTIYAKASYLLFDKLSIFADLQYRTVDYTFLGFDNNLRNVKQNATMAFVNPKVGVNYDWSSKFNIYASYSIGNKEPSRNDFTQSTPNSRPKAETLNDLEFGFKHRTRKIQWGINVYDMQYTNQLVLTGKVNDVGAYNRTNVSKSYRRGVELEAAMFITKKITWNMNLTLSNNKIIDFYDYTDTYDADFNYTGQVVDTIASSDIAFSPNVIGASTLTFELFKNFKLSYITKYVGKQYLDNTSNEDRKLNTYIIDDIRLNYTIKTKAIKAIEFTLGVYNIFNKAYESNGYTYGYNVEGKRTTENFYYPQAGINFLFGVKVSF
jgi:iron complex outermembrane receptor protein